MPVPLALALAPAAISAVMGVGQAISGAQKKKQARNMTSEQPRFDIPKIYGENVGLMEQEAQTGFSAQTLNMLKQSQQQGTAASTNAILQGGGNVSDIAKLYGAERDAMAKLGAENDALRSQKIASAIEARKDLAGMQMQQWKMNVLDKWAAKQQAAALLAQQGNEAINTGLGSTMSALGSMSSALLGGGIDIGGGGGSAGKAPQTPSPSGNMNIGMRVPEAPRDYANSNDFLGIFGKK
jgi:hypothetical protein